MAGAAGHLPRPNPTAHLTGVGRELSCLRPLASVALKLRAACSRSPLRRSPPAALVASLRPTPSRPRRPALRCRPRRRWSRSRPSRRSTGSPSVDARIQRALRIDARPDRATRTRYGSAGPNAFDCSGLVYYATHAAGFRGVPRTSGAPGRLHAPHLAQRDEAGRLRLLQRTAAVSTTSASTSAATAMPARAVLRCPRAHRAHLDQQLVRRHAARPRLIRDTTVVPQPAAAPVSGAALVHTVSPCLRARCTRAARLPAGRRVAWPPASRWRLRRR